MLETLNSLVNEINRNNKSLMNDFKCINNLQDLRALIEQVYEQANSCISPDNTSLPFVQAHSNSSNYTVLIGHNVIDIALDGHDNNFASLTIKTNNGGSYDTQGYYKHTQLSQNGLVDLVNSLDQIAGWHRQLNECNGA
ncbi:hypothetical protein [Pseudoalteromonas prydzensis]|uniref:hypothetical protein n=1 Tax=Pseudoalteromonas prydzensis TaxID=182141 RepID=UPI003FD26071